MAIGPQNQFGAAVPTTPTPGANGPGGKDGGVAAAAVTAGSAAGVAAVQRAFMLGSTVAELAGRIRMAENDPVGAVVDSPRPVASGGVSRAVAIPAQTGTQSTDSSFLLASTCRVSFNRIALLHQSLLPTSSTAKTWFDPGVKTPAYLYPSGPDDYTSIGIAGADAGGQPIFETFPLFDATRRALNCLTLLYLNSTATLLPDVLLGHQQALVRAVLAPPAGAAPGVGPGTAAPAPPPGPAPTTGVNLTANQPEITDADRTSALAALTRQTLLFLGAWDGYLRESFFSGELTAQDEAKLIAYEAGQAIASLSWNLAASPIPAASPPAPSIAAPPIAAPPASTPNVPPPPVATSSVAAPSTAASSVAPPPVVAPSIAAPPVGSSSVGTGTTPAPPGAPAAASATTPVPQGAPPAASGSVIAPAPPGAVWQDAFDDHRITLLQHQIAVVGKSLDDDYRARTGQQQVVDGDFFSAPDPALPSRAVLSVSRSLDFWQHAIAWVTDESNAPTTGVTPEFWGDLRHALIQQAGSWQALIVGQVDLHTYTPSSVVQQILQEVITTFESIVGKEGVVKTAVNVEEDVAAAIKTATGPIKDTIDDFGSTAQHEVARLVRNTWFILIPVVVVGVLGIGLAIGLLSTGGGASGAGGVAGLPGLLALACGGFGLFHARQQGGASATILNAQQTTTQTQASAAMSNIQQSVPATLGAATTSPSVDSGLAARVGAAFGSETSAVLRDFEQGYHQIQKDLADLGYAVAVTAPLVELLVSSPVFAVIEREFDFLDKIIWNDADRKTEVMRVAFAAFGPIGLFALAQANRAQPGASPAPGPSSA